MVTNKLNINGKATVNFGDKNVTGEGEVGSVIAINLIDGEIYYTLSLDNGFENRPCSEGGLPIQYIQVKEGQYKAV
jgi:hypothetical protein